MNQRAGSSDSAKQRDGLTVPRRFVTLTHFLLALSLVWVVLGIQYLRYGISQPLGWDTIFAAARAALILREGPLALIAETNYVNLYWHVVAFAGWLLGSPLIAQMVLPAILTALLAVVLGVLSREIFESERVAIAVVIMTVPFIGILRLLNDLHRSLFAYILVLVLLLLISRLKWANNRIRNLGVLFGITLALSLTELEVYAIYLTTVLAGTLALWLASARQNTRSMIAVLVASIIPGISILLIFPQLAPAYFSSFVIPEFATTISLDNAVAFTGFVALPLTLLGAYGLVRKYQKKGDALALYLSVWSAILAIVFIAAISGVIRLNPLRPLLLLPIPVLIAGGATSVYRLVRTFEFRGHGMKNSTRQVLLKLVTVVLVGIISVGILIPSVAFVQKSLRPQITDSELQKIQMTARLLREASVSEPIIVFYGANYLWKNAIVQSYLYLEFGDFIPYYGKLMYLLTEPEFIPALGTRFRDTPSTVQLEAIQYQRTTLEAVSEFHQSGTPLGRSLVILSPDFYSFPLSEPFLSRFVPRDGIYVLPAGSLTEKDLESWRWFAYSDYAEVTKRQTEGIPWGVAPRGLVLKGGEEPAFSEYRFNLFKGGMYQLRIQYEFTPSEGPNDQAWIEVDGQLVGLLTETTSPNWTELVLHLSPQVPHTVRLGLSADVNARLVLDVIELRPSTT